MHDGVASAAAPAAAEEEEAAAVDADALYLEDVSQHTGRLHIFRKQLGGDDDVYECVCCVRGEELSAARDALKAAAQASAKAARRPRLPWRPCCCRARGGAAGAGGAGGAGGAAGAQRRRAPRG
jgi:hypothetical protein